MSSLPGNDCCQLSIGNGNKRENLSRRRPVGHELGENISVRNNDQQTEKGSVSENTDITTSSKAVLSTTKIDIICLTIYFIAFFVFNLTSIFICLNTESSTSIDTKFSNGICDCKYINSGINPAWIYLPQSQRTLCQE